jgi:cbb3-type cytochrome oxidase maturation protein
VDSLYILIPAALQFCASAIGAFLWAVQRHQFDDLDTEGKRVLFDDEDEPPRD